MRKLKLTLFTGSVIGTIGALGFTIYNIEKNKENSPGFKIKGVFNLEYLKNFQMYNDKVDANVTKENIYFNYEVPFENKSIKQNENKIFNIGTQSELLISLATFKLIEEIDSATGTNKNAKISLLDPINKWFSTTNGSEEDKKVAKILNDDLLKEKDFINLGWKPFNYLTKIRIYNLLTHTSALPNFNNFKTSIKNIKNEDITKYTKNNYYKHPINSYNDTSYTSRKKWKLLDFFNLSASDWIDKANNNVFDTPYSHYSKGSIPLSNQYGPLEDNDNRLVGYNYSPLNFILLANILEKVYNDFKKTNGVTFDTIIDEYVLEPLKMNNTFYNIKRIDKFENKEYKDVDTSFLNASKGYVSTLEDLSKLYKALFKKDSNLLKSKSFEKFFEMVYLPERFVEKDYSKDLWPGISGLKLFTNTFNYMINFLDYSNEQILFIKGISPNFRSYSFYCREKEIIFTSASDVPYSYYSTSTNNAKGTKVPSELTTLINSTFDYDVLSLLEKKL